MWMIHAAAEAAKRYPLLLIRSFLSSRAPAGVQQRFQGMGLIDFALQTLQSIARPANQKSKAGKSQPVNEQHVQHARINRSASAHNRLRVLGAEEPDREVDKWHAERAQNRE